MSVLELQQTCSTHFLPQNTRKRRFIVRALKPALFPSMFTCWQLFFPAFVGALLRFFPNYCHLQIRGITCSDRQESASCHPLLKTFLSSVTSGQPLHRGTFKWLFKNKSTTCVFNTRLTQSLLKAGWLSLTMAENILTMSYVCIVFLIIFSVGGSNL